MLNSMRNAQCVMRNDLSAAITLKPLATFSALTGCNVTLPKLLEIDELYTRWEELQC